MGGNIGVPVLALEPFAPRRIYVLEVSSYQVDLAPSLHATVGILLNVSEDHLDRHGTMENYAALKMLVPAAVEAGGTAVVGVDDRYTREAAIRIERAGKNLVRVSVEAPLREGYLCRRQPHPARDRRQGARGGAARRHRQSCAAGTMRRTQRLRRRRLRRARARPAGDPEGAGDLPRPRPSHAAGRVKGQRAVRQRFESHQRGFRRQGAGELYAIFSGSPAAGQRPAASTASPNISRASARPI